MYCRMLNFRESFIMQVLRGTLESRNIMFAYENRLMQVLRGTLESRNITFAYENRPPDVRLVKLKHCER